MMFISGIHFESFLPQSFSNIVSGRILRLYALSNYLFLYKMSQPTVRSRTIATLFVEIRKNATGKIVQMTASTF